jgi:hypothetical protein
MWPLDGIWRRCSTLGILEETIRRHFEPLLDRSFGVVVDVDGREMTALSSPGSERVPIVIRLGRRRTPSVVGFVERRAFVPSDHEGVAISTFGKVIMLSEMLLFGTLVTVGIVNRHRAEIHRPIMLLATIVILSGSLARIPYVLLLARKPHRRNP